MTDPNDLSQAHGDGARVAKAGRRSLRLTVMGTAVVVASGMFLVSRGDSHVNKTALADQPKGVTVVEARASRYRPSRRTSGRSSRGSRRKSVRSSSRPTWTRCSCARATSSSAGRSSRRSTAATRPPRAKAVAMQARALEAEQRRSPTSRRASRSSKEGGFVSPNEVEKKAAESASKEAQLLATQAKLQRATLEVSDCVLRAPFDGEVAARSDRPRRLRASRAPRCVSLVDRRTVRIVGRRAGDRLRRRRAGRRRCGFTRWRPTRDLRATDRAARACRRRLDADRALRDRRPRSRARDPRRHHRRGRPSTSASPCARDRDAALRGVGARQARRPSSSSRATSRKKRVHRRQGRARRAASSSSRARARQRRRHRGARAPRRRRPSRRSASSSRRRARRRRSGKPSPAATRP